MNLLEFGLRQAEVKKLDKKGFTTDRDIRRFFPRKYYDFSLPTCPSPFDSGKYIAVSGTLSEVKTDKKNGILMLKAKVIEQSSGITIHVMWIGSYYLKNIITKWKGEKIFMGGRFTYFEQFHSYHMNNPYIFVKDCESARKIYPVYTKMSGISEEYMYNLIDRCLAIQEDDAIPEDLLTYHKLMGINEALHEIHHPSSMEKLASAQNRIVYEDMLRFGVLSEVNDRSLSKGSVYNIRMIPKTLKFIDSLPFKLTPSQLSAFEDMKKKAIEGKRINALVQGDVGSGKTMVAFLMMFAMADSGFQAAIMAPTDVLARQHYEKLKVFADKLGFNTVFLHGGMKAKERKEVLKSIADGSADFIVGTHSLFSESVEYKNLSLSVIDEEHKFGAAHTEKLFLKSPGGMHIVQMSATPIPRTLASAIYGSSLSVYDLERPSGRKEVQTAIFNNDTKIYEFIEKQVHTGRQCFVVCPLVSATDKSEERDVLSVDKTFKLYEGYFTAGNKGIRIAAISGKTPSAEAERILSDFKSGDIDILISTTVVEVGVDVPNASVIVINNAEYFGIAQLHQLRGRVGRGGFKGYCILKSKDRENKRLKLLASTTDGYELAKMDAQMRGPGDILGSRQSGKSDDIELIMKYPKVYAIIKKEAPDLVDRGIVFSA